MCSYCGCTETTVIGRYTDEHEAVVNALGDVRRAVHSDSRSDIAASTAALRAILAPHTASEERSLFVELRKEPELAETVAMLCAEHVAIERHLDRVAALEPSAYAELEHVLRRHMDKEDNGLFPAAVIALDGPSWERIVASA